MSLKAFHIFFVTLSLLLAGGFGWWGLQNAQQTGKVFYGILGGSSLALIPALIFYLVWFRRKVAKIS